MRVLVHVPGPPGHGVVRHARAVGDLAASAGVRMVGRIDAADVVHAHFTDALWGPSIAMAADRFTAWAQTVGRPLVVTLHDAPDAGDEPGRRRRRELGYRRVLDEASVAIVAHRHEADALIPLTSTPVRIIELPLVPPGASAGAVSCGAAKVSPGAATIGVLGFIYPGKGHVEVLGAAQAAGVKDVVALGGASPGHDDLVDELEAASTGLGVHLEVTGPLDDTRLAERMARVTVPVWAGRGAHASGSLVTWVAHHRRPIALDRPVSREVEERHPGSLTLVRPDGLAGAIRHAAERPGSTWRSGPVSWSPVGELHRRVYESVVAR